MSSSGARAIFFDAGNTLVYPQLDERVSDLAAAGFAVRIEDFYEAERLAKKRLDQWMWPQIRRGDVPRTVDREYWAYFLSALMEVIGAPAAEHTRLTRLVYDGFRDIRCWCVVPPEIPAYLSSLKDRGFFLGVISNSGGKLEEQLRQLKLRDYFDAVVDSAIVGVEKPHPEIFHLALEGARIKRDEAIFVGDTHAIDVGGARLAGLRGVLIDRVGAYPDVKCRRITSLPELDDVLASP